MAAGGLVCDLEGLGVWFPARLVTRSRWVAPDPGARHWFS